MVDAAWSIWWSHARRRYGAESREIDMEEDDSADYQQAEVPNFPPVQIKEDEENSWPHLSKQFAFQRKRGNSYLMLCGLCLPRKTEFSADKNWSPNLRKHVLVSTVFVISH